MRTYLAQTTRIAAIGAVALALIATTALPAFADSITSTTSVTAGTLTETASGTPTISQTLNGSDHTDSYSFSINADDATGSGTGWNMTITSTQFTTGGGTPHTLATSASSLTGVTVSCVSGATCTNPTNAITYPLTVPAASTAPTAVKFFNAAANTGMGNFTLTPTINVTIPANAYAGTYTSTVTLAIVSGP